MENMLTTFLALCLGSVVGGLYVHMRNLEQHRAKDELILAFLEGLEKSMDNALEAKGDREA